MSEEEIIKQIEHFIKNSAINKIETDFYKNGGWEIIDLEISKAIQGLLNLYKQEKEKNKELINGQIETLKTIIFPEFLKDFISKDKIKEKINKIQNMYDELPKNPKEHLHSRTEYLIVIGELQNLLEEE